MKNKLKSKTLLLFLLIASVFTAYSQTDTTTIPNHSFETWACPTYCNPTGWFSDNAFTYLGGLGPSEVTKSTGAHVYSGNYAVKLETQSIIGNIAPGTLTNGWINSSSEAVYDGSPINYRPAKFEGWYQFAPSGSDTFVVSINFFSGTTYATPIGSANFISETAVSAWTHFSLPITYTSGAVPDTFQIIISSGTGNHSQSGTTAYVDELSLVNCTNMAVTATPTAATCTQNNGSAIAAGSGAQSPYTYAWSNSTTTASITGVAPATYSVVATDANGCTASGSAAISTANVPFTLSLTPTAASCVTATGSVAAAASAGASPYTYAWTNSTTASSITAVNAGNYSVTVTDANGCSTTAASTVATNNVAFTVTPANGTTSCSSNTGTVSVAASAGNTPYTYLWANSSTASSITGLGAGSYDVTVTDAHGCTTSAAATVATPGGPSATDTVTNLTCHNNNSGKVAVTVTGGAAPIHYLWSNTTTTDSLTGIAAGTYTLTITDNNSCSFEVSATVNEPAALSYTDAVTNVTCNGGSNGAISLTPGGGTEPYAVTQLSGGAFTGSGLTAGAYTFVITDNNGCTDTSGLSVTQPNAISLTSATVTSVLCFGGSTGSVVVTPTGGAGAPFVYSWAPNVSTDSTAPALAAGSYALTVTDVNNCTANTSFTVTQPTSAVSVSTTPTSSTSATATDGSDAALGAGGTGSFSYVWATGATTATITGIATGSYCVTVSDANHCTASGCDSVSYTTGINAISTAVIRIYPNPASNQLTIETNQADGKFMLTIYSLDGKMVEQQTIAGEKSTVLLNHLTDGLYTYQLRDVTSGNLNYGKLEILR
jgi:hypothetical protein